MSRVGLANALLLILSFLPICQCYAAAAAPPIAPSPKVRIELQCTEDALEHCDTLSVALLRDYSRTVQVHTSKTQHDSAAAVVQKRATISLDDDPAASRPIDLVLASDLFKTNLDLINSVIRRELVERSAQNAGQVSKHTYNLRSQSEFEKFLIETNQRQKVFIKTASQDLFGKIKDSFQKEFNMNSIFAQIDPENSENSTLLRLLEFTDLTDAECLILDNGAYLGHHKINQTHSYDDQVTAIKNSLTPAFSGKLILFYVKWCGHCNAAKPEWMAAKKIVESDFPDVKMVEYDCDEERELCGKNQVQGYPTILIENTSGDKTPYQGSRDRASFVRAAETLSKKSTLTFKSLRDSYLNKSEFPLKIHQLLSLDDLFGNQTGGDLIVIVFPEQTEPRQFFKSIEIISNSIAESACKSATFLYYFPTDSAINQFLSLPETPMKKIVKVAANTTYVVDSVMDSDIAAYIASCNLSNKAKLFDTKSIPLFKNQKPYLPLYTIIDKYVEDLVAELKKTIKKPIQIIYEDQNILLDIDGSVEDISRQYDITDTSKAAEAVRTKFLDEEAFDL